MRFVVLWMFPRNLPKPHHFRNKKKEKKTNINTNTNANTNTSFFFFFFLRRNNRKSKKAVLEGIFEAPHFVLLVFVILTAMQCNVVQCMLFSELVFCQIYCVVGPRLKPDFRDISTW
jgi:hypothetical protein